MRLVAVIILTACQFTALPFAERLALNTLQKNRTISEESRHVDHSRNMTTVHKSAAL